MGCFIVPATEAIVTTIANKVVKTKEKEALVKVEMEHDDTFKIPFSTKLGWLNKMLWGGSGLLAFEHVWHGEVTASFPFLTAVTNGETSEMLAEMGTTGVMMAVTVTTIWACMLLFASLVERKVANEDKVEERTVIE